MRSAFTSSLSILLAAMLMISPLPAQTPAHLASRAGELQIRLVDSDGPEIHINAQNLKGYTFQVTDLNGANVADAAVVLRFPDDGPSARFADGSHSAVAYTDASGRVQISGIHWGDLPGQLAVRVTVSKGTSHAGLLVEQTLKDTQTAVPAKAVAAPSSPVPPIIEAPPIEAKAAQPAKPASLTRLESAISRPSDLPLISRNEPSVTVTSASPGKADHGSTKKWVIIMAIAAGLGAGAAMAMRGKSTSSSSTAPSAVSIGTPTVSVGNP